MNRHFGYHQVLSINRNTHLFKMKYPSLNISVFYICRTRRQRTAKIFLKVKSCSLSRKSFAYFSADLSGTGITITFIQVILLKIQEKQYTFLFAEPIGSSIPKFSSKLNLVAFEEKVDQSVALTCPAQGAPLPSFRLESKKQYYFS